MEWFFALLLKKKDHETRLSRPPNTQQKYDKEVDGFS
jgi:hypothetical protein